jgi:quinol monooxygenase YgiN
MSKIQSSARIKIPDGKLGEFKEAVIEYIKEVKEKDTGTLQSDWFLNRDMMECEIREIWENSEAVLKHQSNLHDFSVNFFEKFGTPYSVRIYGDPSAEILENAKAGGIEVYSLLVGL